jgi:hypothetical protein
MPQAGSLQTPDSPWTAARSSWATWPSRANCNTRSIVQAALAQLLHRTRPPKTTLW